MVFINFTLKKWGDTILSNEDLQRKRKFLSRMDKLSTKYNAQQDVLTYVCLNNVENLAGALEDDGNGAGIDYYLSRAFTMFNQMTDTEIMTDYEDYIQNELKDIQKRLNR